MLNWHNFIVLKNKRKKTQQMYRLKCQCKNREQQRRTETVARQIETLKFLLGNHTHGSIYE